MLVVWLLVHWAWSEPWGCSCVSEIVRAECGGAVAGGCKGGGAPSKCLSEWGVER